MVAWGQKELTFLNVREIANVVLILNINIIGKTPEVSEHRTFKKI